MGNQGSSAHEPFDRAAQAATNTDLKMKSSVRASLRRARAGAALSPPRAGMERLRRSFRESFRRRKGSPPESARPHQWHADEAAVRAGTCTFPVKYLGCVEVFESRGMQVCEEALKVLRNSRRRPVRAVLHVSGDGLRVVEEETKGLIVDQTIEKVSFCAPDRNHERGFSYICRDGTTRRWMCHGFLASRDSGERLSHAVGCAFAACLERKQRRDKECAVSMSIDAASHAFTRQGSFRKSGITPRRASEADANNSNGGNGGVVVPVGSLGGVGNPAATTGQPGQLGHSGPFGHATSGHATSGHATSGHATSGHATSGHAVLAPAASRTTAHNPFAVERPHAAPHLLERQGSFRGFAHLNNSSPFKRQMSLRISELPSNLERQRAGLGSPTRVMPAPAAPAPAAETRPEAPPVQEATSADPVAAMCQQLSAGLRALVEEPVATAEPVAVPAPGLPHPDAWLGRVARAPGLGPAGLAHAGHAPGLGPAGLAHAGHAPGLGPAGLAHAGHAPGLGPAGLAHAGHAPGLGPAGLAHAGHAPGLGPAGLAHAGHAPGLGPAGLAQAGRAPGLGQAGRAQSYAGRAASTNPFLSPPDAAPAL